jgi:hypothetical protein
MTPDEIIEMAREAGFHLSMWQLSLGCDANGTLDELEAFYKLATAKAFQDGYEKGIAAFNEAVELEREATIKIIKETSFSNWFQADVIEAIRARGEQA